MHNKLPEHIFALNPKMDSNLPKQVYVPSTYQDQFDTLEEKAHDSDMSTPSREELNARLETIETKMDGRIARIEDNLNSKINEVKLEISKTAAEIRSDMKESEANLIRWVVGTAIALGATSITVMSFVLNNATPKQVNQQPQLAPIVIQIPPQELANKASEPVAAPPTKTANKAKN